MALLSEKQILTDIIHLYKEFPCLWDNKLILYTNKEARDQAYEVLLEKYRQIEEGATIIDIKKRLENMRCCYRREHRKVLLSRQNGEDPEYSPQLWYYEELSFLNDVMEFNRLTPLRRDTSNLNFSDDSVKIEFQESAWPSQVKKRKIVSQPAFYLPDQHESDDDYQDDNDIATKEDSNHHQYSQSQSKPMITGNNSKTSEAFGTIVGLQLEELDPLQRIYAEKLICDVIFHARLHKLQATSNINS